MIGLPSLLLTGCVVDVTVWGDGTDTDDPDLPTIDLDGDHQSVAEGDCDDSDPRRYEGAYDTCDGIDNNCDDSVDEGGQACARKAIFDQSLRADVLFVLDDTESMSPHWEKAAEGACATVEQLMGVGYDTQLGVVLTDMWSADAGKLVDPTEKQGDQPWIVGNSPNFGHLNACNWLAAALADVEPRIPVEPDASGGRAAVTLAMDEQESPENEGFFRTDADLVLIFLTDEDDRSEPANPEFLSRLQKQKEAAGREVTIHAITRMGDLDCEGNKTDVQADSILELVANTGGTAWSHCKDDYVEFLGDVGADVAANALGDTFRLPLGAPAQPGSLKISIDTGRESFAWAGSVVLEDPWTLVFTSSRPPAGATISVDYLMDWASVP